MRITAGEDDAHLYLVRDNETGKVIQDCAFADDDKGMYCVFKRDDAGELLLSGSDEFDTEMMYGDITIEKVPVINSTKPATGAVGWQEYFMEIARVVSTRSSCLRRKVGAVFVKDRQILATGYNGVPPGIEHCDTYGCIRAENNIPSGEQLELCRASHAEANGVMQAAMYGVSLRGCDVYIHGPHPCLSCAKLMVTLGVRTVFYTEEFNAEPAKDMMGEAGVELIHVT